MSAAQSFTALVVDDDPAIRQSLRMCLEAEGGRVQQAATAAGCLEMVERCRFDVVFLDQWLGPDSGLAVLPELLRRQPGAAVVIITAYASYESAVEAMKLGAVDYLPKPFTPEQVRTTTRRVVTAGQLRRQLTELQERLDHLEGGVCFETCSPSYAAFLQQAVRAAASDAVILLRGESGTGKTVLARWLHQHSRRAAGPFVTVHCPMLSSELMSSVLFGHKKGAFTGAITDSVGKVEEAEGGTLFLDEVGDLTADAQARLLRFLNDRTYERVGEAKERRADVRLMAATNRDLEQDVRAGRFREDLFFRLNVITLTVPSLRERQEDVLPLARYYLSFFERQQGRRHLTFSTTCEAAIVNHRWPGNLRELRNAVERAVILCPSTVIEPADLGLTAPPSAQAVELGANVPLEAIEREHIARVVARAESFEAAARILGIDVTTLQRKRKRYGLS
ncbi:MAG: sigma-54 dependent transcriptional regulator [Thermogemmata sp.]|nr:sigma-54 dependent transcriptional regulator [Thermogemmata sp.]